MRWIVTGGAGMLGQDVVGTLRAAGEQVTPLDRQELDILDIDACRTAVDSAQVVVNCAAWTDVDGAEDYQEEAFAVNALGPANLARAVADAGGRLVHFSTDYVFDGSATTPYAEDSAVQPVSWYGRTKAAGEWAVSAASPDNIILRTAWLYGANGPCFPRTIARLAAERGAVEVVSDQHGQPTWTRDVADLMHRLVSAHVPGGVYHATSQGETSWFEFARTVVETSKVDARVTPTSSDRHGRPAPRPAYSVLDHGRLHEMHVAPIGDWRDRWAEAAPIVLG